MKKTSIAVAAFLATVSTSSMFAHADETQQQGATPPVQTAPGTQAPAAAAEEGKLVWYGVNDGFAKAKAENKPIIADVYTDWCGWCKRMDRDTYSDPTVIKELNANFIMVKADAEDHGAGQNLAQVNRINGYPTFLIFDSEGKKKDNIVGYKKSDEFLKIIKAYLAKAGK